MATYAAWRSIALASGKTALSNIVDATSSTDANGTDCDKTYWEANAYDQLYSMLTTLPSNPDKGVDGDLWINYDATTNTDSKLVFQTNNSVSSTNPQILWDASESQFAFNNAVKVTGTLQATGNITGTFAGTLASSVTATTQSSSNDTQALATTAFVQSVVNTKDTLSELDDVTISQGLADANLLVYDTGTSRWRNQTMDGAASISDTGTVTLAASQPSITSLGTLTSLQVDNVNINASTISNSSGSILIEGTTFSENDVTIAGDLTVSGDSVSFGQLDVDNMRVSGNIISSTDTNGNIVLDPNGAGTVKIAFQNGTYMTIPNADGNNGQVLSTNSAGTLSWTNSTSSALSLLTDTTVSSPVDGHVLIYNQQTSTWRNKEVTGDISITDGGVTAIASGVIVNADINSSAAIADSKLATITTSSKVAASAIQLSSHSALENSSGLRVKANLAGSGLSMTSGGGNQTIDISSGGVSTAMIADDAVTADKIADGVIPSAYNYWTLGVGGTSANVLSGHNIYFAAGNGLDIAYNTSGDKTITFTHEDTSSQANVNNSGSTYIQDITFDTYGHVTGITSADHSHSGYLSTNGGTVNGVLTVNADLNINSSLLYAAAGYYKVGIGFTPSSSGGGKLEVYGGSSWADSGESLAKFRSQGADARIHINSTSASSSTHKAYTIYEDGNTTSKFSTGLSGGAYKITTGTTLSGTERLKVDSNGNWDIGATGTSYNHNFLGNTGAKFYWKWYNSGTIDKYHYTKRIQPGGAASFALTHLNCSGSELSGSSYVLVVGGGVQCTSVNETSDSRVKTNINNIDSALDTVTQLQGVTFDWQDNEDLGFDIPPDGDRTQFGLIAQDVEDVLPEIVDSQGDEIKSINKSSIIPFLIEAIKELKAEIEILKAGS